jgi:hypothetical protein
VWGCPRNDNCGIIAGLMVYVLLVVTSLMLDMLLNVENEYRRCHGHGEARLDGGPKDSYEEFHAVMPREPRREGVVTIRAHP